MPKLKMELPHTLSLDEALRRVKGLLEDVRTKNAGEISNLHEDWNGNIDSFSVSTALGFSVSGTIEVTKSTVKMSLDLPFIALPVRGRIETMIRERAERSLA